MYHQLRLRLHLKTIQSDREACSLRREPREGTRAHHAATRDRYDSTTLPAVSLAQQSVSAVRRTGMREGILWNKTVSTTDDRGIGTERTRQQLPNCASHRRTVTKFPRRLGCHECQQRVEQRVVSKQLICISVSTLVCIAGQRTENQRTGVERTQLDSSAAATRHP